MFYLIPTKVSQKAIRDSARASLRCPWFSTDLWNFNSVLLLILILLGTMVGLWYLYDMNFLSGILSCAIFIPLSIFFCMHNVNQKYAKSFQKAHANMSAHWEIDENKIVSHGCEKTLVYSYDALRCLFVMPHTLILVFGQQHQQEMLLLEKKNFPNTFSALDFCTYLQEKTKIPVHTWKRFGGGFTCSQ